MPCRSASVVLDSMMLALVCVLECLDLTGLEFHQWAGFALCPLVLLHVTMHWQWFSTQFHKIFTAAAYRTRINFYLNALLLVAMGTVLVSGVLASRQMTTLVAERFGSVSVWRDVHGWLNFTVVVLVGLHLGLNWDWVMGVLGRRVPERPAVATVFRSAVSIKTQRPATIPVRCGRGAAVLGIMVLCAALVYSVLKFINPPESNRQSTSVGPGGIELETPLAPSPRPARLPHGLEQLSVTVGMVFLVALGGRYALRLRL